MLECNTKISSRAKHGAVLRDGRLVNFEWTNVRRCGKPTKHLGGLPVEEPFGSEHKHLHVIHSLTTCSTKASRSEFRDPVEVVKGIE